MVRDDRVRSHPIHDTCSYDSRMNTHTHTYRERERERERFMLVRWAIDSLTHFAKQ